MKRCSLVPLLLLQIFVFDIEAMHLEEAYFTVIKHALDAPETNKDTMSVGTYTEATTMKELQSRTEQPKLSKLTETRPCMNLFSLVFIIREWLEENDINKMMQELATTVTNTEVDLTTTQCALAATAAIACLLRGKSDSAMNALKLLYLHARQTFGRIVSSPVVVNFTYREMLQMFYIGAFPVASAETTFPIGEYDSKKVAIDMEELKVLFEGFTKEAHPHGAHPHEAQTHTQKLAKLKSLLEPFLQLLWVYFLDIGLRKPADGTDFGPLNSMKSIIDPIMSNPHWTLDQIKRLETVFNVLGKRLAPEGSLPGAYTAPWNH